MTFIWWLTHLNVFGADWVPVAKADAATACSGYACPNRSGV